MANLRVTKLFKPHERVKVSGIYDVMHDATHKKAHQVTCVKGYFFPPCRDCDKKVRFRLAVAEIHIKDEKNVFLFEKESSGDPLGRSSSAGSRYD